MKSSLRWTLPTKEDLLEQPKVHLVAAKMNFVTFLEKQTVLVDRLHFFQVYPV